LALLVENQYKIAVATIGITTRAETKNLAESYVVKLLQIVIKLRLYLNKLEALIVQPSDQVNNQQRNNILYTNYDYLYKLWMRVIHVQIIQKWNKNAIGQYRKKYVLNAVIYKKRERK
jgi:hypothetical protein